MINSKTFHYITTLSLKELDEFSFFLKSGLAGSFPKAEKLFLLLRKQHPEFHEKKLQKEHLFLKLFPRQPYEDSLLRYVLSELNKLLEQFFLWKELNQSGEKDLLIIQSLATRKLDKYFLQEVETLKTKQINSNIKDITFYKNMQEIEELAYGYQSLQKNRTSVVSTEDVIKSIDKFYIYNKLRYVCELINRINIFSDASKSESIKNFINQISPEIIKEPSIAIYYAVYKTLTKGNSRDYEIFRRLLKNDYTLFKKAEQNDLFAYAQNFCIKKINSGDDSYLKELFSWYKFQIEKKTIISSGLISQFDYKNIVSVGLRVNELKWIGHFLEKYSGYLHKDIKSNASTYNMARLEFQRRNYKQSVKLLQNVEFTDVVYQLDSKILLLKIYYETSDTDAVENISNSLKILVKRKINLSNYQKQLYLNFSKLLINLNRIKEGGSSKINIEQTLANTAVADKNWLTIKYKELVI